MTTQLPDTEISLSPYTPLAPAITSPDEALLLMSPPAGGSGRARLARIDLTGDMRVREAWDAAEPAPPEGEWPWALAASPAGFAFSTTDGKRFMIARYDAQGRRLPALYGGRYRDKLQYRQSEYLEQRRLSVDGHALADAVLADASGGEWQRLDSIDPRPPLPWEGEMLVDVAVGGPDALYRLVRDPDRLERWAPEGLAPDWSTPLPLTDESRVAAADWGAVVALPRGGQLRFFSAGDGRTLGQADLPPGQALVDVGALPAGQDRLLGAALSLDPANHRLQLWSTDGSPGRGWQVAESGEPLRLSARVVITTPTRVRTDRDRTSVPTKRSWQPDIAGDRSVSAAMGPTAQVAVLTSDGFVELHDLVTGYLGRFQPRAPTGVLTQTTDVSLLSDGSLLLADAASSGIHLFALGNDASPTPGPEASPSASATAMSGPTATVGASPTPTGSATRPTSVRPTRTPLPSPSVTPSTTPTPSPTPIPTCIIQGDKRAAPSRIVLGQAAVVTLTLRADCPGRPHPGGADVIVALDRSGSMAGDSFLRARRDTEHLAAALGTLGYRMGLVSFAADARAEFPLSAAPTSNLGVLDGMAADGGTNITLALAEADRLLKGARPDALKVVVLLSDGQHGVLALPPEPTAAQLAADGVVILALSYGAAPDLARLAALAGGPDQVWPAEAGLDLAGLRGRIRSLAEDSLAGGLTVDDLLGSDVDLVDGSVAPAAIQGPGRLLWSRPLMPRSGMTLSYRVRPQRVGMLPTNRQAVARFTDADGQPASFTFPIPLVEVIAPTPSPSPTATATTHPAPLLLPLLLREPPCTAQTRPLDIALVLDASGSMAGAKLAAAQAAARAFAGALSPGKDRLAIVSFHQEAQLLASLAASPAQVDSAIAGIQLGSGTRMDRGIAAALGQLLAAGRPEATAALILLTDGRQDQEPEAALRAAAGARGAGVSLQAVGFGADADLPFLALLTADPNLVHRADDEAALVALYRRLAVALPCQGERGWSGR